MLAKGEAEAEAMSKKADAYQRYGEAAIVDIVAATLPRVVAEAAKPMGQIDTMTVISTDGASQAVRNVASTVTQGQELAKALFCVDLAALVQRFAQTENSGAGGEAGPGGDGVAALDGTAGSDQGDDAAGR